MTWEVSGSYYEACNYDAVCPCRRHGDRPGGRSTHGTCDFVLSWMIESGHVDSRDLSGFATVMVGSYSDDEPRRPWRVALFVDETANTDAQRDLGDVFLGRIGGDTHRLYGRGIVDVSMVRPAVIQVVHEPRRWHISVPAFVEVRSAVEASAKGSVSCGISDHVPGTELISDVLTVAAPPFEWNLRERCSFESSFKYRG